MLISNHFWNFFCLAPLLLTSLGTTREIQQDVWRVQARAGRASPQGVVAGQNPWGPGLGTEAQGSGTGACASTWRWALSWQ